MAPAISPVLHCLYCGAKPCHYSNDLFESGKAFCITTYQGLFNGLSSIRRYYFPGAVIFDDAHVAETMLRDAMTLRIESHAHPQLLKDICRLFEPHFVVHGHRGPFQDATDGTHATIVMAAPRGVRERSEQLRELLNQYGAADDDQLKYAFPYLRDRLDRCAVLFGRGVCEITPPFLPSLALDVFERPIRRIYLSATLAYKTDFVRAFGRLPDVSIEPRNDAGNGERLILFSRLIAKGVTPELIERLGKKNKAVIAVPSYPAASKWSKLGDPPEREEFSDELNAFRKAKEGVFILVARVDGIDLPHDTCRLMVIDGLPSGASLLERYQWEFLPMRNFAAARLANRIVQLFGRINRGRNDYGVFLIAGAGLNKWLNNDRNLALLPDLIQQQLQLGRVVQQEMDITDHDKVDQVIDTVLGRDASWLKFYGDNITKSALDSEKVERTDLVETRLTEAAIAAANYALAAWQGDYTSARMALEENIEETARADTPLAGWHSIWLGGCFEAEGDVESANLAYSRARSRLGSNVALPLSAKPRRAQVEEALGPLASAVEQIVGLMSQDSYNRELRLLKDRLRDLDGGSPPQMEAAVRTLGEALGFEATRPDNDDGTGPDVLWMDNVTEQCLGFELKTNKEDPATYYKKEIGKCHDHLEWIAQEKTGFECLGLIIVGPDGVCDQAANPSPEMWWSPPRKLAAIRDQLIAMIEDLRKVVPLERLKRMKESCDQPHWTLAALAQSLQEKRLIDMRK
jgi:Helicase C-terminal domain